MRRSTRPEPGAVGSGIAVHVARFALILATLELAPLIGVSGWCPGPAADAVCTVFALVLVTRMRLWRSTGLLWGRTRS